MNKPSTVIHLLHVLPSFAVGGTQRRVVALVDGLGDAFRHTLVALDGRRDALKSAQRPERFRFVEATVKPTGGIDLGNLARLRRLLRREQPDILVTYNWGAIEAALANRIFPICPHLHCEDGFTASSAIEAEPSRRIWTRRLLLARHGRLVVPSRSLCSLAETTWKLPKSQIVYLPNGIDTARFAAAALRRGEGRHGEITIGTLARLSAEKNVHRLLRVFATAAERQPLRLLIAGDGPERVELEREATRLGLADRVRFLGQVDEPESVLSEIDIFALTSDSEQMPYSVLEAMAAGLPVVATDVGDVKEMVAEENRFAVMPRLEEALLAGALVELAGAAPARERIGAANARRARACYDVGVMLSRYRQLLAATARSDR